MQIETQLTIPIETKNLGEVSKIGLIIWVDFDQNSMFFNLSWLRAILFSIIRVVTLSKSFAFPFFLIFRKKLGYIHRHNWLGTNLHNPSIIYFRKLTIGRRF